MWKADGESLSEYVKKKCAENEGGIWQIGDVMFACDDDGTLYYTDSEGNTSVIAIDNNGNVTIEGSVSSDGTVKDDKAPTISATATTNSITFVAKDILSGVAGWNYSNMNAEPSTWNEVTPSQKSFTYTIENLTNNTTYYIWAKDMNGNISQEREVSTRDFDEFSYETTWEGVMATIIVNSPNTNVQFKTSQEGAWENYSASNKPRVESGTTVYFQVTDGTNTKAFETVKPLKTSTITYDANGGIGTFTETAEHTANAIVNFTSKPTRANYEFVGWSQRADVGYADYSKDGITSFKMGTEDVNLYAVWKGTTKETLNTANYGDKVNYSANGVTDWKVFLKDENNVYLITGDLVQNNGMNLTSNIYKGEMYAVWARTRNELIEWLSNTSYWSAYASGFSGATATGVPTLSQFWASYNGVYGTNYSETNSLVRDNENRILYVTHSDTWNGTRGYWLATKAANNSEELYYVDVGCFVSPTYSAQQVLGVRPLVKLPSTAKINWNGNIWNLSN